MRGKGGTELDSEVTCGDHREREKVPAGNIQIVSMMNRQPENVGEILQGLDRRKQQTTLEHALILSFIFFPPSALQYRHVSCRQT